MSTDYFASTSTSSRPPVRPGPAVQQARLAAPGTPGSPRTPLLNRSISSQFGSPGSFRAEQEEIVVWDLGARHLSAGFAGEGRPRCTLRFGPELGRRAGDYCPYVPGYQADERAMREDYELYRSDIRNLDLGLVEDKLAQCIRIVHSTHLQLDAKPRKALLAIPSLLPTPLLEITLTALFDHFSQPPSIMVLTSPVLACVSAGLRCALVIDVGWEESVVTGVGEYREICQRRSVRAGKALVKEMATALDEVVQAAEGKEKIKVGFKHAEDVVERMGWCRSTPSNDDASNIKGTKDIPLPHPTSPRLNVPLTTLSHPAETVLFSPSTSPEDHDDNDLPLHNLAYDVLLHLPLDLRALCLSRIIITGGVSALPGLKARLLSELGQLIEQRGWDSVSRYGSAKAAMEANKQKQDERRRAREKVAAEVEIPSQPRPPLTESTGETRRISTMNTTVSSRLRAESPPPNPIPPHARLHDDVNDRVTLKISRRNNKNPAETPKPPPDHALGAGEISTPQPEAPYGAAAAAEGLRGVETLGAWAGASLIGSLRIKGVHEVEREEWMKHGLREGSGGGIY